MQDYLNGAAGREMMLAFNRSGANLAPVHFTADGTFPLGDPNPVKTKVIREGLDTLKAGVFTLATFFDGDGDRIDFYRGNGAYLSSSFVYAAILPEIRKRFPGAGMGVYAARADGNGTVRRIGISHPQRPLTDQERALRKSVDVRCRRGIGAFLRGIRIQWRPLLYRKHALYRVACRAAVA
jgi:hypothetical protein